MESLVRNEALEQTRKKKDSKKNLVLQSFLHICNHITPNNKQTPQNAHLYETEETVNSPEQKKRKLHTLTTSFIFTHFHSPSDYCTTLSTHFFTPFSFLCFSIQGCFASSEEEGRISGSLVKHLRQKSLNKSEYLTR
jgi:hypothetical protein